MAFSGLHVTCGYAGGSVARHNDMPILGKISWSQTMASADTTTQSAPAVDDTRGDPMFQVIASADSYVAIGAAPNASTGARVLVLASERVEFYAEPGDKLAWVAA